MTRSGPAFAGLLVLAACVAGTGRSAGAAEADERAPAGRIVSPSPGACLGPGAVPVRIVDDFVDDRDPVLERAYSPPAIRERRIDTPAFFPDSFGYSVALDGSVMVVGGPSINDHGGLTYVFRRVGDAWKIEAFLYVGTGSDGGLFGWDVAVEGDRIVAGAPFVHVFDHWFSGRAHFFERTPVGWWWSDDVEGDGPQRFREFGKSVDLSGEWIAIGAHAEDNLGMRDPGAVYLYRSGHPGVWQKLIAPDAGPSHHFGLSVSIENDLLAVGSLTDSVRIYERHGDTWIEQTRLTPSDGQALHRFGVHVDLSGDLLVVGASGEISARAKKGAAYVFERRDGVWTEIQVLTEPGGDGKTRGFGSRVAVDGDTIAVGARLDEELGEESGAVYLFRRTPEGWRPWRKLFAADGKTNDRFGLSFALEAPAVAVGAPGKFVTFFPVLGKVYMFEPIAEPLYGTHGDHEVTLEVVDDAGNRASDSVAFVIDRLPPDLTVIEPPEQVVLDDRPFDIVFRADDEDVAAGDVIHEVVYIEGCPAFDGRVYGDGDGSLQDEILRVDTAERCRIADECGFDILEDVELRFEVLDCAGNVTAETRLHPGGPLRLRTEACVH